MRLPSGKTQGENPWVHSVCPDMKDDGMWRSAGYEAIKRVTDVLLSAFALVLLGPVLLCFMGMIVLDDPKGGPIYVSERVGKEGKTFRLYKFRSMYVDAESRLQELLPLNEADGPAFKIRNDPRVTRVGRFLRKHCFDELPQLVNVLRGDMSLVGPRPPLPREVEMYTPQQMRRLSIRPGLTCYWQIQPQRNSLSFDKWMELDMKYILKRSLWVDLSLILRTIGVVFKGDGI